MPILTFLGPVYGRETPAFLGSHFHGRDIPAFLGPHSLVEAHQLFHIYIITINGKKQKQTKSKINLWDFFTIILL